MNRILSGFAAIAVGFGLLAGAAPTSAEADSVVNKLRDRGLGKWVDRYVQEDSNGKVTYKSQNTSSDAPTTSTVSSAKKNVTAKKKTASKSLKSKKKVSSKKSTKKFTAKTSKKKLSKRKLSNKSGKKKSLKKVAKKAPTKKLSTKSGKTYKVPTSVKNRLASYGISF